MVLILAQVTGTPADCVLFFTQVECCRLSLQNHIIICMHAYIYVLLDMIYSVVRPSQVFPWVDNY